METPTNSAQSEANAGLMVHQVLAVSYAVYLGALFLGFALDFFYPIGFSNPMTMSIVGFTAIIVGTFLCFWAQYVSGKTSRARNSAKDSIDHSHFSIGPYTFTRSPTQYGLLLMSLGLAFLYNSLVMVIMTLIAFLLGKFVFIPMEESHLVKKYGLSYEEYKKKVRF